MQTILAVLFAAMMGVAFVGSAFAADVAKPPQANTATVTPAAPDANKAAGTKIEKKHIRHHKAAAKSHMKEGTKAEKKM
jgi:hypothetical protein